MSIKTISRDQLSVGRKSVVDPTAVLGEFPERSIQDLGLVVGNEAVIRTNTIIYAGTIIGNKLNTGHNVVIREENRIGDNFSISSNSIIDYGCTIGNNVKIHSNVYVAQYTVMGDEVFLAPGVIIANDPHPGCPKSKECLKGPVIESGAKVGINATLLPFVRIGKKALIGSGSVVTQDIPPRAVAVGNPARVTGTIDDLKCKFDPPYVDAPYRSR